jgi:hypothetical protein
LVKPPDEVLVKTIRKLNFISLNNFRRMFMKFRIVTALVVAAGLGSVISAQAASPLTPTFSVTANFAPACIIKSGSGSPGNNVIDFGAYTAFGSAATPSPSTTITFQCSRSQGMGNVSFDTTGTTASGGAAGTTTTGGGVIAGLQYTLNTTAASKSTTGVVANAGAAGTADEFSYTITGTMADNQAGCTSASLGAENCTGSQTRTFTVAY